MVLFFAILVFFALAVGGILLSALTDDDDFRERPNI